MEETDRFDEIVHRNPQVEAIILCTRDGLPTAVHAHNEEHTEEFTSIAATLVSSAIQSGLVRDEAGLRLFIEAEHGGYHVRFRDSETLMIILTAGQVTELELDSLLAEHRE